MSRNAAKTDAGPGEGPDRRLKEVAALDLRALGLVEEGGALNLTGLLYRLLLEEEGDARKTRAQLMLEGWINDALGGNARAVEDILDRAEKGRPARTSMAGVLPSISDEAAGKILEVLCGFGELETGDRGDRAGPGVPA